jgi:cytochrome c biogenesis protein CcmG, thiol:disulfide interchange protein DsbE
MNHRNPTKTVLLSILIGLAIFLGCETKAETKEVKAPDFTLKDLSGKDISLSQYKGSLVVLDFWATWCGPCRMSIPELVKLQEAYRDKGVVVIGISVDSADTKDAYLTAFKEKYKINYPVLRVDEKTTLKYFGKSDFGIPSMFIINREGMIAEMHEGYSPGAVENSLKKLLK